MNGIDYYELRNYTNSMLYICRPIEGLACVGTRYFLSTCRLGGAFILVKHVPRYTRGAPVERGH